MICLCPPLDRIDRYGTAAWRYAVSSMEHNSAFRWPGGLFDGSATSGGTRSLPPPSPAAAPAGRESTRKRHHSIFGLSSPGRVWSAVVLAEMKLTGRSSSLCYLEKKYMHFWHDRRARDGESGSDIALWVYNNDHHGPGLNHPRRLSPLNYGGRGSPSRSP